MYQPTIQNLINKFSRLPSIGPKTAERLVFYLLRQPPEDLDQLASAIIKAKQLVKVCFSCFNFSESIPCPICSDPRRDHSLICVVSKPQDIAAIEKTGSFSGVYHVLGGNINPLENLFPEDLRINQLLIKIKNHNVREIILALNPDMEGETTSLFLINNIRQNPEIKITRLARGLPMGADVEYADEVTLENALKGRQGI
jgi:recombination protein RecR